MEAAAAAAAAARSSTQVRRAKKRRPRSSASSAAQTVTGSASPPPARSSSEVRRAKKRPGTTAAQIDDVVVVLRTTFEIGIEAAAAVSSSHIPRRRRTAQIRIPSRRAKTLRPPHLVSNPPPHDHPNLVVSPVRAPSQANDSNKRARSPRDSDDHQLVVLPCCHNWREPSPRDLDDEAALSLPSRPDLPFSDSDNDADPNRDAKRARTTNLPCCWRDWSNLGDGPAGLIAERVLAYDVADYVRFRAVCSPWRQSSTEPRTHSGLDRRFHPSKWTMLREELASPTGRSFLNRSTGQCIQVDIPELRDHELLALTPEGLLVLARKPPCTTTLCMLNPLTRQLIHLPPLSSLVPSEFHDDMLPELDALSLESHFKAWGSGIVNDDSTVVLCFHNFNMLGMAKPGDDHWTLLDYDGGCIKATPIMFEGCFYCINHSGIMVLEKTGGPPRLEVAAKLNLPFCRMLDSYHLVNICGQLMLVHCQLRRSKDYTWSYNTYRVDLDTGTLLLVKSLGSAGHALFLGMYCSLSVSPEVFPSGSICADTIYLSFDMNSRGSLMDGAYHLADDSVEPPNSFVSRPHTLAECLSLANTIP